MANSSSGNGWFGPDSCWQHCSENLYDVFCAILYVLKSGCQWRMLPSDFPKMSTVYWYYRIWTEEREDGTTLLEEVLKKIGQTGTIKLWKEHKDLVLHFGCPKR